MDRDAIRDSINQIQRVLDTAFNQDPRNAAPMLPAEPSFTSEYFRAQVRELRDRWGYKTFWQDPDAPGKALMAIDYVFLRLPEISSDDQIIWEATVNEMARRQELAARMQHPLSLKETE